MTNINTHTLIVGGGLSGLFSAWLLEQLGQSWTLVEARDRLGGRVLSETVGTTDNDGAIDLGPSWFWPDMNPRINSLVEKFAIPSYSQYAKGMVLRESAAQTNPDRFPAQYSAGYSRRLEGGMASMIGKLYEQLPAQQIITGKQVGKIMAADQGEYLIELQGVDGTTSVQASNVIIAIPPRLAAENIRFEPELSDSMLEELSAIPTWMAVHAKAVVTYEQPFWREQGLAGMVSSQAGPLVEIHDASVTNADGSQKGALMGFVGYNANARKTLGEDKLKDMIVSQLTRLFGDEAATPETIQVVDWTRDALTASAADVAQNPHVHVLGGLEQIEPENLPGIAFAGSEASKAFSGYLEGAIDAAERAVKALNPDADQKLTSQWQFRRSY